MPSKKSATKMIAAAKKQVETQALAKPKHFKVSNAEARERTEQIRETWVAMGKAWWTLGREIERAIEDRVPEALGQSFTEWSKDIFGDGWQKIRRAFLAVKALRGVPLEKLEQISEGNAYVLAHLPEKTRKESEWIKNAIEMPNEDFREKADRYIAKKTGLKDPMVKFQEAFGFATLPKSLAKVIEQALKLSCKINDFDWDQKEGRIACTEDVFSHYITDFQNAQRHEQRGLQMGFGPDGPGDIDVLADSDDGPF